MTYPIRPGYVSEMLFPTWPENHKMHISHIDRVESSLNRRLMCGICFVSIGQKIISCISHIDRVESSIDVRICFVCIYWPENHKLHIAHRPSRIVVRRAISPLYLLARKSQDAYRTSSPSAATKNGAISQPLKRV